MIRTAIIAFGLLTSPALAGSHYHAQPEAAPSKARFIAQDLVWNCSGGACAAAKGTSRPALVCAAVVKQVGALRSFSVAGKELSTEQLEKCNARAD